jgi:hypothetical protein
VGTQTITGEEPLADGMHLVIRLRRDFTVTDAARLMAVARAAYIELNPDCFDRGDIFALPQYEGHRCITDPSQQIT